MQNGTSSQLTRSLFDLSIDHPLIFRLFLRTGAYIRARGDPESVHDEAVRFLNSNIDVLNLRSDEFGIDELKTDIKGREVIPFGPAAGFDKNGDLLEPFSKTFGYLKPGTVVLNYRDGNKPPPRISVDHLHETIDNAQGFPSEGLRYFFKKLNEFRYNEILRGRRTPVYPSICGIPASDDIEKAYEELELILTHLAPLIDGAELNIWSPNTKDITVLRTREHAKRSAGLMRDILGPDKLITAKVGPYRTEEEKGQCLRFAEAFLDGGGDGFTAVNTLPVLKDWPYGSAGRSGPVLKEYRDRAITDLRREFPEAFICASGGIRAEEAYRLFRDMKVNAVEGFTLYTFHGLGYLKAMMNNVVEGMKQDGYRSMKELQAATSQTASARS